MSIHVGSIRYTGTIQTDGGFLAPTLDEATPDAGVVVEGVPIKDGLVDGVDVDAHATRHQVGGADVVQTAICEVSATPPAVTAEGQFWYDTSAAGSSVSSTDQIRTVTADYTLTADDVTVFAKGTLTITLPTAVGISGKWYRIKNVGTGVVTVVCTGAETIETGTKAVLHRRRPSITPQSDNVEWWIM